nr:copia protein [Tanacetum cinerariifolium]
MEKHKAIPRRNKMFWHFAKDDSMFTTIRVISKPLDTQLYCALLPQHLTNQAMLEFEAYKTYHAYATGKKKLNAQGLETLSEKALSEAKQIKIATKRSKIQFHSSHTSGSGADEGTGVSPGVPDNNIDDKGYWDDGCSRHMTGNISYLSDYESFDRGYVSFGQGGCKITGKGTIKTAKLEFENVYFVKDLKTPRQHNMYSIDLKNIVPHRDLTCLVSKASVDEVRPIGTKWVLKNKKDEKGIVIINKARLVAQGHTQEEGIDYDEVFILVARIEAIRLFLAYASFMGFTVYQMDMKSAFLYGTIDEEV